MLLPLDLAPLPLVRARVLLKLGGRGKRRKARKPLIERPMSWSVSETSIRLSVPLWRSCQIIHLGVTRPMHTMAGEFIW